MACVSKTLLHFLIITHAVCPFFKKLVGGTSNALLRLLMDKDVEIVDAERAIERAHPSVVQLVGEARNDVLHAANPGRHHILKVLDRILMYPRPTMRLREWAHDIAGSDAINRLPSVSSLCTHLLQVVAPVENCPVCLTEVLVVDLIRLSCGHATCQACVRQYVNNTELFHIPRCPVANQCAPLKVADLVRAVGVQATQQRLIGTQRRMMLARGYAPCPNPPCGGRGIIPLADTLAVAGFTACTVCDTAACTMCLEGIERHAAPGFSCSAAAAARRQNRLQELAGHVSARYKACPSCLALLERVAGCNAVLCQVCATHFCWLCGAVCAREGGGWTPQHCDSAVHAHFVAQPRETYGDMPEAFFQAVDASANPRCKGKLFATDADYGRDAYRLPV